MIRADGDALVDVLLVVRLVDPVLELEELRVRQRADVVRQIRLEVARRERQRRVPAREEAVARALGVELGTFRYVEDLAADRDLEAAARVHVLGELGFGEDARSASARERHGQERYR